MSKGHAREIYPVTMQHCAAAGLKWDATRRAGRLREMAKRVLLLSFLTGCGFAPAPPRPAPVATPPRTAALAPASVAPPPVAITPPATATPPEAVAPPAAVTPPVAVAPRSERVLLEHGTRRLLAHYDRATCEASGERVLKVEVIDSGQVTDSFELAGVTVAAENAESVADAENLQRATECVDYLDQVELGDFDFDGYVDVALPVDASGPYGAPTYDVLLFHPQTARYRAAPELSELTREYIGIFGVDAKRRVSRTALSALVTRTRRSKPCSRCRR